MCTGTANSCTKLFQIRHGLTRNYKRFYINTFQPRDHLKIDFTYEIRS